MYLAKLFDQRISITMLSTHLSIISIYQLSSPLYVVSSAKFLLLNPLSITNPPSQNLASAQLYKSHYRFYKMGYQITSIKPVLRSVRLNQHVTSASLQNRLTHLYQACIFRQLVINKFVRNCETCQIL